MFYTNKTKKQSVWTVPEEIKDAVALLEAEESGVKPPPPPSAAPSGDVMSEVERIKAEVARDMSKRKTDESAEAAQPASKRQKVDLAEEAGASDGDEDDDGEESEEEEWQKEAAAQLAAEAEEEVRIREAEEARRLQEERGTTDAAGKHFTVPERVDLSLDEAKALFKALLREKDINPLHPWDTCLPLFVSDPRYVLLPSVAARREAFDEYCRDRSRELRSAAVKKDKAASDPKEEFERLLREQVTSTRASWSDFRRAWKKNRQFYSWGRDDYDREKRFKAFLRELGEKKRAAAQKAEADFFTLLKEHGASNENPDWKQFKRGITSDPRYDAVGSSSLREELFKTFLKVGAPSTSKVSIQQENTIADQGIDRSQRKERAVKEREEKIKAERSKVEAQIGRSRQGLNQEEDEREFSTMLTDAIRDPQTTWEVALPQLKTDPRFTSTSLSNNRQLHLFHDHVSRLQSKYVGNLQDLFQAHAPSLATKFDSVPIESISISLPATKLGMTDESSLRKVYEKWQRERAIEARAAFDEMLKENSFVEFWGRLQKIGGEGVDGGVKADEDEDTEEGEGGGGRVDMKALAKSVDIDEMVKVLRNDKRYIMFEHVSDQRETWLRDYLSQLAAPNLSVHLQT